MLENCCFLLVGMTSLNLSLKLNEWMSLYGTPSSLQQQQNLLCVYDDDHRIHFITSSTIINNALNMTHSLYKKKNASNQVLVATTSCNLNN